MAKKMNYDIFIVKFYRNDGGWRFTIWERVCYVTNNSWCLFYLCWRNGKLGDKRGLSFDACYGTK